MKLIFEEVKDGLLENKSDNTDGMITYVSIKTINIPQKFNLGISPRPHATENDRDAQNTCFNFRKNSPLSFAAK